MKRALATLFVFALLALPLAAADYDPVAELRVRAAKLKAEETKARAALAAVEGKYATLRTQRSEVATQVEKLQREKLRVRGFQMWNAFAGSMGATFDVLQKVNPGSSAFIATASFVTDQVYNAMNTSGSIPARLNKLDSKVKSLSPKLRQLQAAYSMTPQEVADQLVVRGMAENTWVQRFENTPEVIAESKSVVTGKVTFILEAIAPAITELEEILAEMDGVLRDLAQLTPNLRLDTKRIPTELHDVERQIEAQEQIKRQAIPPLPEPATVDMNAARDYAAGGQEMVRALQSLSDNQIGCHEHSQRHAAGHNGASRTYYQRASTAFNRLWGACSGSSSDACAAAWRAYHAYVTAEHTAYRNAIDSAQKTINQMLAAERDGPVSSFNNDLDALRASTLFIQGQERTFATSARDGASLANLIWGDIHWRRNWSLPVMAPIGGLTGAGRRYAEWLKMLEDAKDRVTDSERLASNETGAARALSGRTPSLDQRLMKKRALWGCYDWHVRYANGRSSPESDLRWLHGFDESFQSAVEANQEKAKEYQEMLLEALMKARTAAPIMAGEEEIVRLGRAALEARRTAMRAYDPHQLDVSGSRVRDFLSLYQISHEGMRELERMVQEFADEKKLEAYARTLVMGEPTYNPTKALHVLDRKGVEELRKNMGRQVAAIDNAREAFQNGRKQAEDAYAAMSSRLARMRSSIQNLLPEQAMLLEEGQVFKEVFERLWWDAWWSSSQFSYYFADGQSLNQLVLPDPADFGESSYGMIPLMEKYIPLAEKYLALVNPMIENVRNAVREAKQIDKLSERVASNSGWAQLSRSGFAAQIAGVRKEVMAIYEPLQKKGKTWSGSPLDLALRGFNLAVGRLASVNSEVNSARDQADQLQALSARVGQFLASPGSIEAGEALSGEVAGASGPGSMASAYARQNAQVNAALTSLNGQAQALADWLARSRAEKAMQQVGAVQRFYEAFAQAYSSKNLGSLTRMMATDWRADDADLSDLEDTLSNSFRVFDRIQFKIQGLSIQPIGANRFEASYSATITGHINQLGLKHEETARVTDTVANTPEGMKIQSTRGGRLWLR
ncbi:MAG: hypothetical protein Q8Q28_04170 [Pseudomonadota bacterium]|nr:hypothetical protein [Pseudomonadota bacterium]